MTNVLYKQAKYTLEKEIRVAKRNYSGKLRNKFSIRWLCFSVERYERNYQLWDTIPQHCGEPTTGRRAELIFCRFEKNTIPTSCNLYLPHTCTADKWRRRAQSLQNEQKKEGTRPRRCDTSLSACVDQLAAIFTQIFNRSLELFEVPSCFKRSTIIPIPKKPKNYWT